MPNVREIVIKYLKANGYDGLYSDECGCVIDDLIPCDSEGCLSCEPGITKSCTCDEKCGVHVGPPIIEEHPETLFKSLIKHSPSATAHFFTRWLNKTHLTKRIEKRL